MSEPRREAIVRGLVALAALAMLGVSVGVAAGWPYGVMAMALGVWADTMIGDRDRRR